MDFVEKFLKDPEDDEYECPDCHELDDVSPYRIFRCGESYQGPVADQLSLFAPNISAPPPPAKHPDDGCGYGAEQMDFFGPDQIDPDSDPMLDGGEDFTCPHCGCTKYQQVPVAEIKRGDPMIVQQCTQKKSSA